MIRAFLLVVVAASLAFISPANASLLIDLRSAPAGDKTITFDSTTPPAFIDLNVYAVVIGAPGNPAPEAFHSVQGNFVGTSANDVLAGRIEPFVLWQHPGIQPFNADSSDVTPLATSGSSITGITGPSGYISIRSLAPVVGSPLPDGSSEVRIARVRLWIDQILQPQGEGLVNFIFRTTTEGSAVDVAALWVEDAELNTLGEVVGGTLKNALNGDYSSSSFRIIITPEPTGLAFLALGALGLLPRHRCRRV